MNEYEDILDLPRPVSKSPKMTPGDRAKIFAPFAALKGFGESVKEREDQPQMRRYLSEDAQSLLNRKLSRLEKKMMVTVSYFEPTKNGNGPEWGYTRKLTGLVSEVDPVFHTLTIVRKKISMEFIYDVWLEEQSDGSAG